MDENPGTTAAVPGYDRWPAGGGTGGCDRDSRANGKAAGMTQIGRTAPPGSVHGLVPPLTSFVGREAAVAAVADLLEDFRFVTLTGPGGVGQTRLARVPDPALVPAAVAVTLGVRQAPGMNLVESMSALLSRRQLLLIMDNCEHVLAATAELCLALLPFADDVRILATSREPIGV